MNLIKILKNLFPRRKLTLKRLVKRVKKDLKKSNQTISDEMIVKAVNEVQQKIMQQNVDAWLDENVSAVNGYYKS